MVVLVRPVTSDSTFASYTTDIRDEGQVGLIVSSIFSELLADGMDCYPANLEDRYAFLLNFPSDQGLDRVSHVAAVCREAVKFIQDNFCLELRVCVSAICDGFQALHDAFRETERVSDDSNTAYNEGVCVRSESGGPNAVRRPEPTIEKQYLNALVTQDFQMARQLTWEKVQEIYGDSGKNGLDRVKMFLNMRMQTTGSVLAVPLGEIVEGGQSVGDACMELDMCSGMDEIEKTLEKIFGTLDRHYNTAPSDYTGTTGKVIHLINKKYMEPDLSVEMICDCLGKSRSYLSRMFKENTGMNLLDYLHTTRLNEAKKLLNETDLGISEIAAKVGYYSGWTLARVFKRYEGITPTAYRKAFCGQSEA
jgi:AraC-like DNA-binding protein